MFGPDAQGFGGVEIGAAGQAGKVDDECAARQLFQHFAGQHRRGDRVDDGVLPGQQHRQAVQRGRAVACTPGIGALHGAAGGHGGVPAQKVQPPRHGSPDAPIAKHEKITFPDGAAAQLQKQRQAALGGGHGVQAFQLGPLEVVKQRQAGLPSRRLDGRTGPPGQQQRAGAHALQGAGDFIADAFLRHGQQGKICQAGILGPDDAQARRPQNLRSRLLAGIMPDHAKGFWHRLFPPLLGVLSP